ncbi:2-phosphosulfolactate phosphatase [Acetonema longum]|uniref:Probable 2-phosphosulfolactate phosphatase n=1 Tax=Acetonema longum DSM 6540 TaxID=1009370 RepID=F7NN64_9FIRM|nr:2-phosphosulfolactate phosphatase [Acetonema longum]EGO62530.1 hypothetical protein ALO_17736 [Acetonema longum DSM 6540]
MKLHVTFLPAEVSGMDLSDTVCIVLDIFRATSSIVTAAANGCQSVLPVLSAEEAQDLARQTKSCLLAGERKSVRIEGFDLGNSPAEFSRDKVQDRPIIMATTNGTVAIRATEGAWRTWIGSFLNAAAVCRQAQQHGKDILIVCAGTERLFSLEDALCAGQLVEILQGREQAVILSDAAYAALLMYTQSKGRLAEVAGRSRNGQRLYDLGRTDDIAYCLQSNILDIVPEYKHGTIRH